MSIFYPPIPVGAGITGPGSSTTGALSLWADNTGTSLLSDSSLTFTGGVLSGVTGLDTLLSIDLMMGHNLTFHNDKAWSIGSPDGGTTLYRPGTVYVGSTVDINRDGVLNSGESATLWVGDQLLYVNSTDDPTQLRIDTTDGADLANGLGHVYLNGGLNMAGHDITGVANVYADASVDVGSAGAGADVSLLVGSAISNTAVLNIGGNTFTYNSGLASGLVLAGGFNFGASTVNADSIGLNSSLRIGFSAAATTPGSVVRKMQVYDSMGVSLGFIPIYDTIT